MPTLRESNIAQKALESGEKDQEKARRMALRELGEKGIDPGSPEGLDFLLRVSAFGIMGVQPPKVRREL
jgi:hypothetical protein